MNIINNVSKKIINKIYNSISSNKLNKEVYEFGLYLFINKIIFFLIILLIASILSKLYIGIIYLFFFSKLRKYVGGLHFKNGNICFIFSILISSIIIYLSKFNVSYKLSSLLLIIELIIIIVSPIVPQNKEINSTEYKSYKIYTLKYLLILNFFLLMSILFSYKCVYNILFYMVIFIFLLIIAEFILRIHNRRKS